MRILDPALPLSNPRMARMAAETIVCCGFNATRAARELRPDLKAHRNFAHRLMREPAVKKEIERIMEKPDRNATRYQAILWEGIERYNEYVARGEDPPKHISEIYQTSMRLLGKSYLDPKKSERDPAQKPMVIEGLGEGLENLTAETKTKVVQ